MDYNGHISVTWRTIINGPQATTVIRYLGPDPRNVPEIARSFIIHSCRCVNLDTLSLSYDNTFSMSSIQASKSMPKSMKVHWMPSFLYSSCSSTNMWWLKNCCNFSLVKLMHSCSKPLNCFFFFFFYVRVHVRTGEQKREEEEKVERRDKNHLSVRQVLRENQSICYIEYLK